MSVAPLLTRSLVPHVMLQTLDCLPDPAFLADGNDRCLHANPAAVLLLGMSLDEMTSLSVPALLHSRTESRLTREIELPEGTLHLTLLRPPVASEPDSPATVPAPGGRIQDIEAANRELEAFACSIAHDLQAPLRTMSNFANILVDDHSRELSADAKRYVRVIEGGARKLTLLVDNLLRFSRLNQGSLHRETADPTAISTQTLEDLIEPLRDRRIEAKISEMPTCEADPALLRQVYTNLVSNALKYSRSRPVTQLHIGSRTGEDGKTVYFVRDNGVGFDPQFAHKMFEMFQRLHTEEEFEGTGVGLSFVRRIVERHGGRVWGESVLGEGATFYFTLA
jgi:signal transduction histidine kinase